jgi:type IV pilus assembly protein PilY1
VLGDIVDSSPTWVGPASSPYTGTFTDKIGTSPSFPENTGQTYTAFKSGGAQTRLNVVYAGANDGSAAWLSQRRVHSANTYNPTQNDGYEVLAYMPGAIVNTIHSTTPGSIFQARSTAITIMSTQLRARAISSTRATGTPGSSAASARRQCDLRARCHATRQLQ